MKNILAFGDSNTWGLIPKTGFKERYPSDKRWTGILRQNIKGAEIIEEGLCGRTTVFEDKKREGRNGAAALSQILKKHAPLSGAIIMLGTNDCKTEYGATPEEIGEGIKLCLTKIEQYVPSKNILLVSPIYLGRDVWKPEKDPEFDRESIEKSKKLKAVFKDIAKNMGANFLAASDFAAPDDADNEHMDETGHRQLALALYKKLLDMEVI
ncbi:MAG: arylesterase [Clostridia bacterium]|nr:arylesterase [Clostridia bacterium]